MKFTSLNGNQVGVVLSESLKTADMGIKFISSYGMDFLTPKLAFRDHSYLAFVVFLLSCRIFYKIASTCVERENLQVQAVFGLHGRSYGTVKMTVLSSNHARGA